jgi:hypothetical protein
VGEAENGRVTVGGGLIASDRVAHDGLPPLVLEDVRRIPDEDSPRHPAHVGRCRVALLGPSWNPRQRRPPPGQSCCSRAAPSSLPAPGDPAAIFTPRQFLSDRDPHTAVVLPPRFLALPAIESPRFGRIVSNLTLPSHTSPGHTLSMDIHRVSPSPPWECRAWKFCRNTATQGASSRAALSSISACFRGLMWCRWR